MVRNIIDAYRKAYAGLPSEVWMLSFALFINRCGSMVLAFMSLFLHEELLMEEGSAAQMFSIYGIGSLFGTYLGGRLTKTVGAVRLVILFLLISVPLFFVIPLLNSVFSVGVALFFLAVFSEGVRPPNNTAIAEYSSVGTQARAFGLQRMALNLGVSFGPAIGGFLAEVDYQWLFIADGLTTLVCALILLRFFGLNSKPARTEEVETATNSSNKKGSPLADSRFLVFLGFVLLTAIIFFQFHATYPLYLKAQYGMQKSDIGLLFSVNTVMIVVCEMLLVDFAQRWTLLRTIAWGAAFSCFGFGILPFSTAVWFCVLSMIVITIGEMLMMPMATAWVAKRGRGRDQGMYMGWYAMNYSAAAIIGPLVGGWSYNLNKHVFWYVSLGITVVALIGFYAIAQREDQDPPEPESAGTDWAGKNASKE